MEVKVTSVRIAVISKMSVKKAHRLLIRLNVEVRFCFVKTAFPSETSRQATSLSLSHFLPHLK
jgi:hypothetical protein